MSMKLFFEKLEKTPRKWKMRKDGKIRIGGHCPISKAVGIRGYDDDDVWDIFGKIGLTYGETERIINAADLALKEGYPDYRLRLKILKACGLR